MRTIEIDMRGPVWLYYPSRHKTSRKKKARVIALGPQAQAALKPFLNTAKADAYVFSPLAAMRERFALRKTHRCQPVHEPVTQRRVGERYIATSPSIRP